MKRNEPTPAARDLLPVATYRFVIVFLLLVACFEALFLTVIVESALFRAHIDFQTSLASWSMSAIGIHSSSTGNVVGLRDGTVRIEKGCDGLEVLGFFSCAVIAAPTSWRARLLGVFLGAAALLGVNLLRIISLSLAYFHWPGVFETLHTILWPILILLSALLAWMAWARRALQIG